jgi:hypothetical protein
MKTMEIRGLDIKNQDLVVRLLYRWKDIFVILKTAGSFLQKCLGSWRVNCGGDTWLAATGRADAGMTSA